MGTSDNGPWQPDPRQLFINTGWIDCVNVSTALYGKLRTIRSNSSLDGPRAGRFAASDDGDGAIAILSR